MARTGQEPRTTRRSVAYRDASKQLSHQLQNALESRVVIEQAKGILAERNRIPTQTAFELLRRHARSSNLRVHAVAQEVLDGTLEIEGVTERA